MIGSIRQQIAIGWCDHETTLALCFLTETDGTGNLCKYGRLLRLARFEQVGNAGQTTGNITGLRTLLGNTRDNITSTNFRTIFHADHGQRRQEVVSRNVSTRQAQLLALVTYQ